MEATCRQLMLFTEASLNDHARTCQSQGSGPDSAGSGRDCGSRCSGLLARHGLVGLWLRTSVEQSISPSIPSRPVWMERATKSGLSSFLHLRLVRHTNGRGSSSSGSGQMWPTVCAHEARLGFQDRSRGKKGTQQSLSTMVRLAGAYGPRRTETVQTAPALTVRED